jgi:hypothetical protein
MTFTATHTPTGRRVSVSGRDVLYSTPNDLGTLRTGGAFEAAWAALPWRSLEAQSGEAA